MFEEVKGFRLSYLHSFLVVEEEDSFILYRGNMAEIYFRALNTKSPLPQLQQLNYFPFFSLLPSLSQSHFFTPKTSLFFSNSSSSSHPLMSTHINPNRSSTTCRCSSSSSSSHHYRPSLLVFSGSLLSYHFISK